MESEATVPDQCIDLLKLGDLRRVHSESKMKSSPTYSHNVQYCKAISVVGIWASTRVGHLNLINVLIFFVWMSYKRLTASLICFFVDRTSTMKTCDAKEHIVS